MTTFVFLLKPESLHVTLPMSVPTSKTDGKISSFSPTLLAIFETQSRFSNENTPVVPPLLGSVAITPLRRASIQSPIIETFATLS